MCGIAGLYSKPSSVVPRDLLLAMAGELAHRGPDGVGLYLDGSFGMVNTRLSIIDLAGGDQPLSNEDGRYWAMQNGEIYNYPELMEELEGLGHRFRTRSDTEVIVHAFEEWGEGCLGRLNGEFVLAVYDRDSKRLFLARDRFGIRPLFLADYGGDFVFASEAKALLRHPSAERRIDPFALVETFTIWAVQPDRSAFVGVRELPAGHSLWVGPQGAEEPVRWWDIRFGPREGTRTESVEELQEELLEVLDDATRIRLRADVPVGVYLSGGLDSSATTALARRHTRGTLEAFSVAFEDPRPRSPCSAPRRGRSCCCHASCVMRASRSSSRARARMSSSAATTSSRRPWCGASGPGSPLPPCAPGCSASSTRTSRVICNEAANSATSLSRNGKRPSTELAMSMRSP